MAKIPGEGLSRKLALLMLLRHPWVKLWRRRVRVEVPKVPCVQWGRHEGARVGRVQRGRDHLPLGWEVVQGGRDQVLLRGLEILLRHWEVLWQVLLRR